MADTICFGTTLGFTFSAHIQVLVKELSLLSVFTFLILRAKCGVHLVLTEKCGAREIYHSHCSGIKRTQGCVKVREQPD